MREKCARKYFFFCWWNAFFEIMQQLRSGDFFFNFIFKILTFETKSLKELGLLRCAGLLSQVFKIKINRKEEML
jgi:hypothetical protein